MEITTVVSNEEKRDGRIWAALGYVNILFLIAGYLTRGKNQLVTYHRQQAVAFFVARWLGGLGVVLFLRLNSKIFIGIIFIYLFSMLALLIMGIINAWRGLLVPLPVIGEPLGAFIEAGMGNAKSRR